MYRRDPFNDWGVVVISLISAFLTVSLKREDRSGRTQMFLQTESLIPLLEEDVEIKLFGVIFEILEIIIIHNTIHNKPFISCINNLIIIHLINL